MNLVAEEKGNQGVFVSLAYSVVFFSSEKKSVWGVHSHNFPWARGREKTFLVSSILANLRNTFWGFWPWLAKSFCFQLNSVFSWWLCLSLWAPNMELGQRVFLRDFWALCPKRTRKLFIRRIYLVYTARYSFAKSCFWVGDVEVTLIPCWEWIHSHLGVRVFPYHSLEAMVFGKLWLFNLHWCLQNERFCLCLAPISPLGN